MGGVAIGSGSIVSKTFQLEGSYTIVCSVTDAANRTATSSSLALTVTASEEETDILSHLLNTNPTPELDSFAVLWEVLLVSAVFAGIYVIKLRRKEK
jgi:predicted secreted protein